jgi:hypothetical protein
MVLFFLRIVNILCYRAAQQKSNQLTKDLYAGYCTVYIVYIIQAQCTCTPGLPVNCETGKLVGTSKYSGFRTVSRNLVPAHHDTGFRTRPMHLVPDHAPP